SYRDLDEMSQALAAYLQSKGLQKGARVALMMPNVLQYPVSTAAVLRAGYAVVNVNPLYTPRELEHQLKDSGAEAIVVLENFATTVQQVIARTAVRHVIVGSMGDLLGFKGVIVNLVIRKVKKMVPAWSIPGAVSFNDALAAGRSLKLAKPKLTLDDVAFLQYTGGTNGLLNTPGFDKLDFSKLKISNGGGMATQKPVAEKWLKTTGCALSEGYGLSETSPTLTCNRADIEEFSGTIGLPVPSTYLSIRDADGK